MNSETEVAGTVKEKKTIGFVIAHNILELQLAGILWEWGTLNFIVKWKLHILFYPSVY